MFELLFKKLKIIFRRVRELSFILEASFRVINKAILCLIKLLQQQLFEMESNSGKCEWRSS